MISLKPNEAEARERLRAFWAGSRLDRPVVLTGIKGPPIPPAPPQPWDRLPREEAEWLPDMHGFAGDWYLRSLVPEAFAAESMPRLCFAPASCLGLPAALLGTHYRYDSGTAWFDPMPDVYERPLPRFDPANARIARVGEIVQAQLAAVRGRAFVNPPLVMDALTTLALLRTPEQLCIDIVERPETVRHWCAAVTQFSIHFYEWIYRQLLAAGHGEAGSFFTLMAEGRMEAVQCDFAVMLSPEQFEAFALPDLRAMTDYLDFSLYHLDGTCQLRFLDLLATLPKLKGIQWNPEPGAGSPLRWLPALRQIRERHWLLAVSCANLEEAEALTRALGPNGLALFLPAFDSPAALDQALTRLQRAGRA